MSQANVTTVVLSIDASKQAEQALDYYMSHLYRPGSKLVFVHVIELPDISESRQVYMSPAAMTECWQEEQEKAKKLQKHYTELLKARQVPLDTVKFREEGGLKPGQTIVHAAKEEGASMIVCGTRGQGKLRRTIMGSVSDYIVHHAHCPVVVCRHADAASSSP